MQPFSAILPKHGEATVLEVGVGHTADAAVLAIGVEAVPAGALAEGHGRADAGGTGTVAPAPPTTGAHAVSHSSRAAANVRAWTVGCSVWRSPARSSSPRMPMMPPARWTSSMWYVSVAGATLQMAGEIRLSRSMSAIVKSTCACGRRRECAARCWWVPIAMSRVIAFSNASLVQIERGRTGRPPSRSTRRDRRSGARPGGKTLAIAVGGDDGAVARQRQAERLCGCSSSWR